MHCVMNQYKTGKLFEKCAREVAARRIRNQASEILKIMDDDAMKRLHERDLKEQLEVGTKVNAEVRQREYDKLRKQIASAKALKEPVKLEEEETDEPQFMRRGAATKT